MRGAPAQNTLLLHVVRSLKEHTIPTGIECPLSVAPGGGEGTLYVFGCGCAAATLDSENLTLYQTMFS